MKKVINIFSGREMGTVKGNTWYNKNGAVTKFISEGHMINWLTDHNCKIVD